MFSTVDVLGQKVDVFVIDVLKVDVIEVVQMGWPGLRHIGTCIKIEFFKFLSTLKENFGRNHQTCSIITHCLKNSRKSS